jgi:hypothetical protein
VISSTNQTINSAIVEPEDSSIPVTVSFSVDADTVSKYNTSTNEYTVPCSGYYQLESTINYENTVDTEVTLPPRITIQILRNGSAISTQHGIGAVGGNATAIKNGVTLTLVKYLNKNDILKVTANVTNIDTTDTIPAGAFRLIERSFSGFRK